MVVKRLKPVLVEAVARGYLAGSGWKDYQAHASVCGVALPPGLNQAGKLPARVFTPAATAQFGSPDENVDLDRKSVGLGQSQAVRVGFGCRRPIKKKTYTTN